MACGALQSFGGQFQFGGMITPQCFEHLVLFHGRYCKRTSAENAVRLPNRNRIPAVPQNRTEKKRPTGFVMNLPDVPQRVIGKIDQS